MSPLPDPAASPDPTSESPGALSVWARTLRVHQWVKNLLVLLPPAGAHTLGNQAIARQSAIAFAALCAVASSGYLVNDLRDLTHDRRHASKRLRPIALGIVSPGAAWIAAGLLLALGAGLALSVSGALLAVTLAYMGATVAYSTWLKRIAVVDVMTLAGLYAVRILAGTVATGVPTSSWLLTLAIFLFVSLALVKRTSELRALPPAGRAQGRDYRAVDLPMLEFIGCGCGIVAVLVLALYCANADVTRLYRHPDRLWLLVPAALYWTTRLWLLAHRGEVHDDPVVETLRDPVTYVLLAVTAGITLAAL